MKTILQKLFFVTSMLLCVTNATAHDFWVDGIYYAIISPTNKTVEVTFKGNSSSYSDEYRGKVVIPKNVTYNNETYSVTTIGNYAFYNCTGLTSIEIPNSVTSIGESAFEDCTNLTNVTIGNSVTSIGKNAFDNTTWYNNQANGVVYADKVLYKYKGSMPTDTNIQIKDGTQSIAAEAFENCTGLTNVTIPNSVTSIGKSAFDGCSELKEVHISDLAAWCGIDFEHVLSNPLYYAHNLYLNGELVTELVIPDGVNEIKHYTFYGCSGFTSITIPNSVTSIGNSAFRGCSGITSITIPNSVNSIGYEAFYVCTGLITITIPNSVTSIGIHAFDNTTWYNNQADGVVYAGKVLYKYKGSMPTDTNIQIKDGTQSIAAVAFNNCTGLTSITIPNSVTSIGNSAFRGCSGLTSITIPNSVTSIGVSAFEGCTGLKTVVNFSNLTFTKGSYGDGDIAYYANNVYNAPNGSIEGDCVFCKPNEVNTLVGYLGSAMELTLPGNYKGEDYIIGAYALRGCSGLTSITIPNSVTSIGYSAFEDCTNLTNVTIGNSVTSIGRWAFQSCTGLKEVHISDLAAWCGIDFEDVLSNPLYYAHNLYLNGELVTELVIPDGVNEIKQYAFYSCTRLTNVTIPNSVTSIGESAFQNCTRLTSITIPNSVTSIGESAFQNCTRLTNVTIPNSVTSIGKGTFEGCTGLTSITIPNSVTSIGNSAFYGCSGLASVTIPNSVTTIRNYAFGRCTGLTSVEIPNGVTSIGDGAFSNCTGLTSITIPNSVTSIGKGTFKGCTGLTSITIPNSVNSIGEGAFQGCTGLTSITIPNSVTNIGNYAFNGCKGLTSITIPNSVTSIGIYAFEDCTNLTNVTIGNSVTSIEKGTFEGCTGLTSIEIPNSVTSIGAWAFDGCTGLTSITIPNSVNSIGGGAFQGCTGIKTVVNFSNLTFTKGSSDYGYIAYYADNVYNAPNGSIEEDYIFVKPNEVNTLLYYLGNRNELNLPVDYKGENYVIGDNVFKNYTTLTSVTIPNSVTSIGDGAFEGCTGLTSITIPNNVTNIEGGAFQGCTGLKTVVNFSNSTFTKGSSDYGYIACYADNVYNAPNGSIEEDYIFGKPNEVNTLLYYLGNRNELNLPVDYKGENYVIGDNVFKNYTTLTSVTIPNSVTSIGDGAFKGCTGITSITIPNSVTSIGESAFEGCTELESVTIGNSVRSIGGSAFNGCNNVMSIYNFSEKAITCSEDIFSTDTYNNATLYVPRGRIAAYSRTTPWNSFYIEEMKEFNITYIVDGEGYMVVKVEYGATIEPLEEPTKEGHTFSGWSEIPETMPAEDVTITGSFTANNYIVTFMIDGEVYDTATVEYGTKIELPTPPEKEGYIFSGWVGVPETMPAKDITITSSFTINSYILTYIVDGEVYATDSIAYGATIEPLEEPSKEGHTFSGWSEIPAIMPAEDVTITGSFTVNSYTVTFIIDGEVYDTATVEYGTEIELPTPPEKEGYIFSGWVGVPETMPAEDIVIEGSYEVDTTGINAIELDLERNEVYNLNGLRITETENLSRGFYIINGKKVYVK